MRGKIEVTLRKDRGMIHGYKIKKLVNTRTVYGKGGKLYEVGQYVTPEDVDSMIGSYGKAGGKVVISE